MRLTHGCEGIAERTRFLDQEPKGIESSFRFHERSSLAGPAKPDAWACIPLGEQSDGPTAITLWQHEETQTKNARMHAR